MALVGSTGSTGRRKPVELHTRATAQRAGSYDANTPDPQELAKMRQAQELSDSNYSPMDFASQVYNFPGKVYDDADQSVRGLLGLLGSAGSNVLNDQAPFEGVEADPIIQDTLRNWTHPMEYANEHPFGFMGDVAGAAALGGGALASGAERFGTSIPAWLGDETGAIGNLGKLLEEDASSGRFSPELRNVPQDMMSPSRERPGMTRPDISVVDYGDTQGIGLRKADDWSHQGNSQIAYNDLWNRVGLGEDLPKPGAAMNPTTGDLVTEAALGARDAGPLEFQGAEHARDIQNISLMDYIAGNNDRSFTHNMMSYNDRPLPIDEGMAFKSLKEDPRHGSWFGLDSTPEQWPGYKLTPEHNQLLDTAYAEINQALDPEHHIGSYDALYENAGEAELQAAMERISNAQDRGSLFNMGEKMNPWDDIEQPGIVPNGPGLQAMIDRLAQLKMDSSWEPSSDAFLSPTENLMSHEMAGLVNMNASGIPQVFDNFTTLGPSEMPMQNPPSLDDILNMLKRGEQYP